MTRNDLDGLDVSSSILTNMVCNNNKKRIDSFSTDNKQQLDLKEKFDKGKNTDLSKSQWLGKYDLEKLTQKFNTDSDGSIISTSSTDAILHNSLEDDVEDVMDET